MDLISRKAEQKIKEDETVDLDVALPDDRETAIPPGSRKNLGTVLLETLQDILTRETKFERQELGYLVDRVDRMSGEQFEEFLAECFQRLGYTANTTPKTNDFGADLILIKDGRKTVVQAKRYQGKVGNSAVQEVVAAVRYYEANNAIVATNSQFTPNARELARANNVQLWEREQLIDLILRAQNAV
ncbi:MAG: restriction endonuclease [Cyanobacteria bacterium J055]|nr:MAG: restriction endonuclease [Cyanobacteria bacterium J055]